MFTAAAQALSQILSPPMRSILWKSIGLAIVLISVLAIGMQRLLSWASTSGGVWAESTLGSDYHTMINVLSWMLSIVEREHYPAERVGTAQPFGLAITQGIKTALLTIVVYLIALPFVFLAGVGFIAFFIATAWLLGREYFELAAMRFRTPAEAKAMRKQHATTVFTAGLFIAAFVSIPIVNLATPLFGMAFMVHMHKRLRGPRPELIEPSRITKLPVV
jgi:uncharacterized protein involved in cysteine biosynthesis